MRCFLCYLLIALFSGASFAHCSALLDKHDLQNLPDNLVIGNIEYQRNNVFDLNEKGTFWLHRFANHSHILTTEGTIKDDVLFNVQDVLNLEDLAETERLLRSRDYLRKASVTVTRYCQETNSVDVLVQTWDNWSLLPKIDFSSEGGESDYSLGLADDNILGSGNSVQLDYIKENKRSGYLLSLSSPNIFGSHWNTLLRYADNSDGEQYHFSLTRPFYRLSSDWSFSVDIAQKKEEIKDYLLGKEVNIYKRENKWFETFAGIKLAEKGNYLHRLNAGITLNKNTFYNLHNTYYNTPDNRDLSTIWLEYQFIENHFKTLFNIHQFNRVEDINLGWQATVRLGSLQSWLGADQLGWQLDSHVSKVWHLNSPTYLFATTRYQALHLEHLKQFLFSNQIQLLHQLTEKSSAVAIINADFGKNLFQDEALYLGGDTGLRAYPLHYQRGDNRIVATAEYRHYTDWSILHILDVGFAGFIDAGKSWGAEQAFSSEVDNGIIYGVGAGLRLLSSHSSRGTMIHIDFAHPFSNNHELDKLQVRLTAKKHF